MVGADHAGELVGVALWRDEPFVALKAAAFKGEKGIHVDNDCKALSLLPLGVAVCRSSMKRSVFSTVMPKNCSTESVTKSEAVLP